jgi:exodeoxyribonuclease VII large subunit
LPRPEALLSPQVQTLDELAERLRRGLGDRIQLARGELQRVGARLSLPLLRARLDRAGDRLTATARLFASLDPARVLDRGYVRVTGTDGRTLVSRAAAASEAALALHFRDGVLGAVPAGAAPSRPGPRPRPAPPEQGKLL